MCKFYTQQVHLSFAKTEHVFSPADPSCGAPQLWSSTRPEKAWELPCGSRRTRTTCWPCSQLTGCSKLLHTFPSNAESSRRSTFYFRFILQNSILIRGYRVFFKYLSWYQCRMCFKLREEIVACVVFQCFEDHN